MYYTFYTHPYLYASRQFACCSGTAADPSGALAQNAALTRQLQPWISSENIDYASRLTYWTPPVNVGAASGQWSYWHSPHEARADRSDDDNGDGVLQLKDEGAKPFVIDIEQAAKRNRTFRTAIWTGKHLQVTVMSIPVGESIGLELHPGTDQFLRIEEGDGIVQMGDAPDRLDFERRVSENDAIMVPAGKWHNVTNTGRDPLKLYSIYAPPEHPFGTVHATKQDALAAEGQRV